MSVSQMINRPCTIERTTEGGRDARGDRQRKAEPVETVCELQQEERFRRETEGEVSHTRWTLFLLAGTEISSGDTVVVDGRSYEVYGEPWHVVHPLSGVESHVQVSAKRNAGPGDTS